jgi:hypothetical protein
MIDYEELSRSLSKIQCSIANQQGFHNLEALCGLSTRVICGASPTGKSTVPCGFTFWIQDAGDISYLGLWTGRLFILTDSNSLLNLCVSLCVARSGSNTPLANISDQTIAEFGLVEIDVLHLSNIDEHSWKDARKNSTVTLTTSDLISKLKSDLDHVEVSSSGTVYLDLGNSQAVSRISAASTVPYISFAFFGGFTATADHIGLLHLINKVSGLVPYDGSWGNKIDIADPFYCILQNEARSREPANWP